MMYRDTKHNFPLCQDISENFQEISSALGSILGSVSNNRETVAELIARWLRETDLKPAEVEANAKKRGLKVSAGYIDDLKNERTDNPSGKKMKAIAAGFRKPEQEIVAVVMGWELGEKDYANGLIKQIDEAYKHLSPAKQKEKRSLLEMVNRELQREL